MKCHISFEFIGKGKLREYGQIYQLTAMAESKRLSLCTEQCLVRIIWIPVTRQSELVICSTKFKSLVINCWH